VFGWISLSGGVGRFVADCGAALVGPSQAGGIHAGAIGIEHGCDERLLPEPRGAALLKGAQGHSLGADGLSCILHGVWVGVGVDRFLHPLRAGGRHSEILGICGGGCFSAGFGGGAVFWPICVSGRRAVVHSPRGADRRPHAAVGVGSGGQGRGEDLGNRSPAGNRANESGADMAITARCVFAGPGDSFWREPSHQQENPLSDRRPGFEILVLRLLAPANRMAPNGNAR
jgi:hypothetical protein